MIAKFKKTSRPRWAGAMLLLAALGCIVLTNAYVAKADFTFGTPTNLGPNVNGTAGEYGPSVSADGLSLYFSSNRTGGSGGWDIWVATRATTNTDWSVPVNLGAIVNTTADEGRPSISADGLSLFYETNRSGGSGDWDIWITTRATTEHEWGTPVNLGPTVNSWAVDSGPSISADGLSLFFESGRTGLGLGDIWVTRRATITGPWEPPVNLGSPVNTSDFDVQPSISADGMTLFFTSNRSGNQDLWVTTRADISDPWATPVNLGSIVNSAADDVFPCIAADGKTLYFNSSRPGGVGSYDLWQASILPVVDLNGDGKVDIKDLRKLAQYWGQDEPSCDIAPLPSGDGIVDNQDLMVLAEYLLKELQPIAHWKLDETEGDIAQDSVGKNNGTLHGNPAWQPADGAVDGALQFDGADDYISTDFILNPVKGSFSMFVWIKGGEPGQVIISQKDTTEGRTTKPGSEWLWADSSNGRFITALMHPLFDPLVSESVITDNRWHHVGLVYDFDALKRSLYVDGVEVAKDTNFVAGINSEGGLIIGAGKYLDSGSCFSGLIDDIRIYDEVLSAEEVAELVLVR